MHWQREQVLALAPDTGSLKAAQGLTTKSKWPTLGANQAAVWGECQGSGAQPYQTVIDLSEPAFKCSCPSRKFPCKHGLALFLLLIEQPGLFAGKEAAPAWVQSWLEGRTRRKEAKAEAAPATTQQVNDEKAQAKRADERTRKVENGVAELGIWLKDLVRAGFAEAQTQPYSFWQQTAARMIDAQAPGLAAQVQALGKLAVSGNGWAERLTQAVGRLFLLLEAYKRLQELPPATQMEVRTLIGWHQSREEVLAGTPAPGRWRVLSHTQETDESLISQRVWLQHVQTLQYALILNFAHERNRQSLEVHWVQGTEVECNVYYYASSIPLRALGANLATIGPIGALTGMLPIPAALNTFQQGLGQNPWLMRFPLLLENVTLSFTTQGNSIARWFLYDQQRYHLTISRRCQSQWQILSMTGGAPTHLFGEWLEDGFLPLSLWSGERGWPL